VNDKRLTDLQTGEFFHDMYDFRQQLEKIVKNADIPHHYEPQKFVYDTYGDVHAGAKLLAFVMEHFSHRVKLPAGTTLLLPGGF
jgi:hypothetical protein